MTPTLRRRLRSQRALAAPFERHRHPVVVSLVAEGQARGAVVATALVDDGGITNYAVRIALRQARSGWLVSTVDDG